MAEKNVGAEKSLVMYYEEDSKLDPFITYLAGNTYEETVYAVTRWVDNEGSEQQEDVELAVHVDDMIKMRDYLNRLISKIGPAGEYTDDNVFIKAIEEA